MLYGEETHSISGTGSRTRPAFAINLDYRGSTVRVECTHSCHGTAFHTSTDCGDGCGKGQEIATIRGLALQKLIFELASRRLGFNNLKAELRGLLLELLELLKPATLLIVLHPFI